MGKFTREGPHFNNCADFPPPDAPASAPLAAISGVAVQSIPAWVIGLIGGLVGIAAIAAGVYFYCKKGGRIVRSGLGQPDLNGEEPIVPDAAKVQVAPKPLP